MYDKVILDTIKFTDYKLEFTDDSIYCLNIGNFENEIIEYNSLLNVYERTISLGDKLWNILDTISFGDKDIINNNFVSQIENNLESQKYILEWIKKYGLVEFTIDYFNDELDYGTSEYLDFDNFLQETAKEYFGIKKDIRLPIYFKTKFNEIPNEIKPSFAYNIYMNHKWDITNIIVVALTISALMKIKTTIYKTNIGSVLKIINSSSELKNKYENMINEERTNYSKGFGKELSEFSIDLFSKLSKYIKDNFYEKNFIKVEPNEKLDLKLNKNNNYKLFNNVYILKNPILGAYEYFTTNYLNSKISEKKDRICDRCGQKLIYSGRLCFKCKKIIGGELLKLEKISPKKLATVKNELDLLKTHIIPKEHVIDNIYYQRKKSEKHYYSTKNK